MLSAGILTLNGDTFAVIVIHTSNLSGRSAAWFSALGWGPRGRWFESSRPDQYSQGVITFQNGVIVWYCTQSVPKIFKLWFPHYLIQHINRSLFVSRCKICRTSKIGDFFSSVRLCVCVLFIVPKLSFPHDPRLKSAGTALAEI